MHYETGSQGNSVTVTGREVHDRDVTYVPWTDGWSVGYRVTRNDHSQPDRFVYFTPSMMDDVAPGDDATPTVFVYQGGTGDPAVDMADDFHVLGD